MDCTIYVVKTKALISCCIADLKLGFSFLMRRLNYIGSTEISWTKSLVAFATCSIVENIS